MLKGMAGVGETREELTRQERPLTCALYFMPSLEDLVTFEPTEN
jgi:hypothetical protein